MRSYDLLPVMLLMLLNYLIIVFVVHCVRPLPEGGWLQVVWTCVFVVLSFFVSAYEVLLAKKVWEMLRRWRKRG